jgi:polysaccharide export outer membrane protein
MKKITVTMILMCLMAGGAQATKEGGAKQAKGAKAQVSVTPDPAVTTDPGYKIGAQDVLKIDVWREDQFTRSVPVRPDGKITLPLLHDVQAAGLTPMELANVIREQLKNFVNDPQVSVSVSEINSRRIYVSGEVVKPGAYPLFPQMTALQALTGSGGFNQFARIKNIHILRVVDGKKVSIPFNYKGAVNGKNPTQDIELQAGDVIVVP